MKIIFVFCLFSFALLISCAKEEQKSELQTNNKPVVVTVNYPLYYFAQRIGGEHIDLVYPIPGDVDPAYWTPNERAISIYQSADLIIDNGAGYAKWMDKISLPSSRIVNTSRHIQDKYIALEEGSTHSHGPEGEHVHKGFAFTTWLDFKLAQQQAAAIKKALIRKIPEYKSVFDANLDKLNSDLKQLDDDMKIIGAGYSARPLFGSHPVYQYLAVGYKLHLLSVHWEADEMPAEKDWGIFKNKLKRHPGNVMLWEDQPLPEVKNRLKELGVASVVFSPCANMPDKGDFYEVMKKNINNFK